MAHAAAGHGVCVLISGNHVLAGNRRLRFRGSQIHWVSHSPVHGPAANIRPSIRPTMRQEEIFDLQDCGSYPVTAGFYKWGKTSGLKEEKNSQISVITVAGFECFSALT